MNDAVAAPAGQSWKVTLPCTRAEAEALDADGLAARLERLFDENLRRTMGRSARRLAERYPISRNTDRMLAVHHEIQTRARST